VTFDEEPPRPQKRSGKCSKKRSKKRSPKEQPAAPAADAGIGWRAWGWFGPPVVPLPQNNGAVNLPFWNPGPYNVQTADGRWLPGPYARAPLYGYGSGGGYIYYGPGRTQHMQNTALRSDTSRDVEIAPADSDPQKWYSVVELDGNITQRTRYTIDSGDIGKVRWFVGQDSRWYAQRLRDD